MSSFEKKLCNCFFPFFFGRHYDLCVNILGEKKVIENARHCWDYIPQQKYPEFILIIDI